VGNVLIGSPLSFEHFPKCIRYSVSIAEKVSNTLWAFPKESPTPFRYCSNGPQELLGLFGNILYISLGAACLYLLRLKIEVAT
jgi:hypothetical protein